MARLTDPLIELVQEYGSEMSTIETACSRREILAIGRAMDDLLDQIRAEAMRLRSDARRGDRP